MGIVEISILAVEKEQKSTLLTVESVFFSTDGKNRVEKVGTNGGRKNEGGEFIKSNFCIASFLSKLIDNAKIIRKKRGFRRSVRKIFPFSESEIGRFFKTNGEKDIRNV